jgi:hypothetical protein
MAQAQERDDDDMPAEVDLSDGVRGKFYSPNARFQGLQEIEWVIFKPQRAGNPHGHWV